MSADRRRQVLSLYRQLLYMGKEYPLGYDYFHQKCRAAFMRQEQLQKDAEIEEALKRGEYVLKELEAMYMLRKYRALKRKYYDDDEKK